VHGEAAGPEELPGHVPVAVGAGWVGDERHQGEREASGHGERGHDPGRRLAQPASEQAVDEGAGERQQGRQRHELDGGWALGHPRTSASWSTSVVTRYLKMATRMPRPTATSAAATASTMNTAPCPSSACTPPVTVHWRANATIARLAALSISSMERKTRMALRRVSTPTAPNPKSTALRATKYSLGTLMPARSLSGRAAPRRRRRPPRAPRRRAAPGSRPRRCP